MFNKIFSALLIILFSINNIAFCKSFYIENSLEDAVILSQNTKQPVLVIFSADWCKFCQIMKKDIDKNFQDFDLYIICYIDKDNRKDLVKEYKVKNIPDYFVLKNNVETNRTVGYNTYQEFLKSLDN